jgi:hypothetical protein
VRRPGALSEVPAAKLRRRWKVWKNEVLTTQRICPPGDGSVVLSSSSRVSWECDHIPLAETPMSAKSFNTCELTAPGNAMFIDPWRKMNPVDQQPAHPPSSTAECGIRHLRENPGTSSSPRARASTSSRSDWRNQDCIIHQPERFFICA